MSRDDHKWFIDQANYRITHRLEFTPPTREEINVAIDTLNRFYEHAPFGWGEIEHTVNALAEYRHRMGD